MGGDDRFYTDEHYDKAESGDESSSDTPASVVFMEMMRRAAASDQPEDTMIESEAGRATLEPEAGVSGSAMSAEERRRAAALQAQRIRRVERRKARRRRRTVGMLGGLIRSLLIVLISGGLIATILSWWTNPDSLDAQLRTSLVRATEAPVLLPTTMPTPNWLRRIGIVSGHYGRFNDPGAVCEQGGEVILKESDINFAVAQRVVQELRTHGYTVDLLEEFDDRLEDYKAAALVSIHSNDCTDYGEFVSGYLVSQAEARPPGGPDARLVECIAEHYGTASQLPRRFGFTRDMTDYHLFREINVTTPGVIVELGFMRGDRELLTGQPDLLARGIVDGILCFMESETTTVNTSPEPTPVPAGAS